MIFTAVVLLTHLPPIVDQLMATQLGSMVIDLLWIFAGCVFWWPVVLDVPHQPRFTYPVKMGYLGVKTLVAHIKGETVQRRIDTGVRLVTPSDMNDPEVKELLQPDLSKWLK